jgi:thioredoxin 1
MIDITSVEELNSILQANETVLIDFYADWCAPCKMMMPVLESLSKELPCTIVKINIESLPDLAKSMGIRSIPTLKLFSNNEEVATKTGALSKTQIIALIDQV